MCGLAIYEANLFTVYVILGHVAFEINCNSSSNCTYALLLSPLFPSGFGSSFILGSNRVVTGFASSSPCLININLMLYFWDIHILLEDCIISIPIILEGSPISVISHSDHKSILICLIVWLDFVNSSKSSTHTIIIAVSLLYVLIYAHGSECNLQ